MRKNPPAASDLPFSGTGRQACEGPHCRRGIPHPQELGGHANISLLLLGHECFVQRKLFEQACATPSSPVGKDGDTGKAQGIQIPLDGSDGD